MIQLAVSHSLALIANPCSFQLPVTFAVDNDLRQEILKGRRIVKKRCLSVALFVLALSAAQAQKITAAGATFPYPIYSKWFSEYSAAHPGVEINYQSIGSGGGIKQVCSRDCRLRRLRHAHDRRNAQVAAKSS